MYKTGVNTGSLAFAIVGGAHVGVTHVLPSSPRVTQASARQQVRKRRSLKEVAGYALACLLMAAIFDIALINMVAYPDCNRVTRDCFLVQHLWGAK